MKNKIAIFSDIHGNLQALESIIKDIKEKRIDNVYCLGDVIGIGPNPKECLDLIINNNIKMVLGNHELYFLKGTDIDNSVENDEKAHHEWIRNQLNKTHEEYLKTCPLIITEKIEKYTVCFEHFIIKDNSNDIYPFEDLSIINNIKDTLIKSLNRDITFIGHEHNSFEMNINNKRIIDVGSSGCTKDDNTFYTLLTFDNDIIKIEKIKLKYNRKVFEDTFNNISYSDKEIIGKIFFGINSN